MKILLYWILLCFPAISFAQSDSVELKGPYSYEGLSIVLLCAKDRVQHSYLTLEQALATHRAVIHENNSQTLWIDNLSDSDLFIQSTDIIKGGQQDRMIANDMIVPARTSSRDLHVFCVEQGRSTKRGEEPLETFSTSNEAAPLPHMRVVAKHELTGMLLSPHLGGLTAPDPETQKVFESLGAIPQLNTGDDAAQQSVWKDVSNVQNGLTRMLRDTVTKNSSPTSLELALEHSSFQDKRERYLHKLSDIVEDNSDCIGYAYAIDGEVRSIDQYGSHALFLSMWPKLLKAAATEAIMDGSHSKKLISIDSVEEFLSNAMSGKSAQKTVNDRTTVVAYKSDTTYTFITHDKLHGEIHKSIVGQ
jgi:hypothetical protein